MKQLVIASYSNGVLDNDNVTKISSLLKSEELKIYIKALKFAEKKSTVLVESPFTIDSDSTKEIQGVFPSKKIVYNVDPSLLLGMKITDNDDVYDLSLKNKLERIESFLEEQYD